MRSQTIRINQTRHHQHQEEDHHNVDPRNEAQGEAEEDITTNRTGIDADIIIDLGIRSKTTG
jgi:hypothetical protein